MVVSALEERAIRLKRTVLSFDPASKEASRHVIRWPPPSSKGLHPVTSS